MRQVRKSRFFTFMFSFLPGAAEMYMGFMRMGLSLMLLFFVSFMLPALFNARDIFICIPMVLWFYGFFHARNLSATIDPVFYQLEDKYIWEDFLSGRNVKISEQTGNKWIAGLLILLGSGMLWGMFKRIVLDIIPDFLWDYVYPVMENVPNFVIAVLLIAIGVKMISGKKVELNGESDREEVKSA